MDRGSHDRPVVVTMDDGSDHEVARPGVIVWLAARTPDPDEVARAAAMRRHPANTEPRHLRAVS